MVASVLPGQGRGWVLMRADARLKSAGWTMMGEKFRKPIMTDSGRQMTPEVGDKPCVQKWAADEKDERWPRIIQPNSQGYHHFYTILEYVRRESWESSLRLRESSNRINWIKWRYIADIVANIPFLWWPMNHHSGLGERVNEWETRVFSPKNFGLHFISNFKLS